MVCFNPISCHWFKMFTNFEETKPIRLSTHNDRSDVLKGYLWIYSPRHKIWKAPSRPNFSNLLGKFSSCVTCNLLVNIVNNTTKKPQNFKECQKTQPSCIFSFLSFTFVFTVWLQRRGALGCVFSQLSINVEFLTSFLCIVVFVIDLGLYFWNNISTFSYFSDCIISMQINWIINKYIYCVAIS